MTLGNGFCFFFNEQKKTIPTDGNNTLKFYKMVFKSSQYHKPNILWVLPTGLYIALCISGEWRA